MCRPPTKAGQKRLAVRPQSMIAQITDSEARNNINDPGSELAPGTVVLCPGAAGLALGDKKTRLDSLSRNGPAQMHRGSGYIIE
ncbi:hypothetical protein N7520_001676 [Penicillium odoratum]|uniref:uncharacterized protein n=1 Tax=Penicillium odoratum TaxID=1167516 RepID=UPI002546D85B|nr:uncharacterized protein N7520_001676 [Penicillium odoratum]KAJ5778430.1 hypothetical protein N7520_001676 [Penicillium odoratum]